MGLTGKRSNGERIKLIPGFTERDAKAANPKQEAMDHWLCCQHDISFCREGCQPVNPVDDLSVVLLVFA